MPAGHLGVGQRDVRRGGPTDRPRVFTPEVKRQVSAGVTEVVFPKQGAHQHPVHPKIKGRRLQSPDLPGVDPTVHRAHGKQGVQQQQRLGLTVLFGERLEVELLLDGGSEGLLLRGAKTCAKRPQLLVSDIGPVFRGEGKVEQRVQLSGFQLGSDAEGSPHRFPVVRAGLVGDDPGQHPREVDRETVRLATVRPPRVAQRLAESIFDLGRQHRPAPRFSGTSRRGTRPPGWPRR